METTPPVEFVETQETVQNHELEVRLLSTLDFARDYGNFLKYSESFPERDWVSKGVIERMPTIHYLRGDVDLSNQSIPQDRKLKGIALLELADAQVKIHRTEDASLTLLSLYELRQELAIHQLTKLLDLQIKSGAGYQDVFDFTLKNIAREVSYGGDQDMPTHPKYDRAKEAIEALAKVDDKENALKLIGLFDVDRYPFGDLLFELGGKGFLDKLTYLKPINDADKRLSIVAQSAYGLLKKGQNADEFLTEAENLIGQVEPFRLRYMSHQIFRMYLYSGQLEKADIFAKDYAEINNLDVLEFHRLEVDLERLRYHKAGIEDYERLVDEALQKGKDADGVAIIGGWELRNQRNLLLDVMLEQKFPENKILSFVNDLDLYNYKSDHIDEIIDKLRNAGYYSCARAFTQKLSTNYASFLASDTLKLGDKLIAEGLLNIGDLRVPVSKVEKILSGNNSDLQQALGYLNYVSTEEIKRLPYHVQTAVLLGKALRDEGEINSSTYSKLRKIVEKDPTSIGIKTYVENAASVLSYKDASSELIGFLNQISRNGDEVKTVRILKSLIEINNPRGETIATQVIANESLSPRFRDFLAKKLIEAEYWDKNLGVYLSSQGEENRPNQRKILSTLINDFGLTPDLGSYQILEKPGILKSDSLEERVTELKRFAGEIENLDRQDLLNIFEKNPDLGQIYYMLKGGEYHYSVVNDYSPKKFEKILKNVRRLNISDEVMGKFGESLIKAGMSKEESQRLLADLLEGKPPIVSSERVFRFTTNVEFGSKLEEGISRLQQVWKSELRSLLIAKQLGENPQDMEQSLGVYTHPNSSEAYSKLASIGTRLKLDHDKISMDEINGISKDLRNSLMTRFKSTQKQDELKKLKNMSDLDVICKYLEEYLPNSPASSEWKSHMLETMVQISEAQSQRKSGKSQSSREYELTFLDKGEDFMRALRFADAAICCFNSSGENFERAKVYVPRLNADPLSFMMDLKEVGSNNISGFIFGRMGMDPVSGKPIIMLNGIYSQEKSEMMTDNILKIVEEQMGRRLGAEAIAIGSQYNGVIAKPEGYSGKGMEIQAVRALNDSNGRPEEEVYDDIGKVANGKFIFSGYVKQLRKVSSKTV